MIGNTCRPAFMNHFKSYVMKDAKKKKGNNALKGTKPLQSVEGSKNDKEMKDNRSRQKNPNNDAYWRSRGKKKPPMDGKAKKGNAE